ncbi:hypothetical protein BD779DRAFT_1559703 [Infundibulicybe gibba]|nr:hypothetical protein BD779DRAFT_1559703 [Infundibulicybe gibba]
MCRFNEELRLIHWQQRWSIVRVMYACCRNYPLLCWPVLIWAFLGHHTWDTYLFPCGAANLCLLNPICMSITSSSHHNA